MTELPEQPAKLQHPQLSLLATVNVPIKLGLMAYLVPALPAASRLDGHQAELETLTLLRHKLSQAFTIYHSVHWTRAGSTVPMFGEADFIIVNPAGSMLVIEQKRGPLEESSDGLHKRYGDSLKSVPVQIHRTLDGLRDKFKRQTGHRLTLDYLLFCPDHRVTNLAAAGLDAERIVDARHSDTQARPPD